MSVKVEGEDTTVPVICFPRKSSADSMSDLRKMVLISDSVKMRSTSTGSKRGFRACEAVGNVTLLPAASRWRWFKDLKFIGLYIGEIEMLNHWGRNRVLGLRIFRKPGKLVVDKAQDTRYDTHTNFFPMRLRNPVIELLAFFINCCLTWLPIYFRTY